MVAGQVSFEQFRDVVEGLATTEGRLVASAVLVVLAILVAAFLVPVVVRVLTRTIHRRLLTDGMEQLADDASDYIPTTITGTLTRITQAVVVFLMVVSLLVVWGLVDLAVRLLQIVGFSVPLIVDIAITFGLFILAFVVMEILDDLIRQFSDGAERITKHQEEIMLRLGHVAVLIVVAGGVLTLWGYDLSGLLVGAGFLGIVVGLAARQTLGAMIAGFVLMFSRPFTIGDWVEIGNNEGIVTNITIMNTRLRNFDGESIVIPNDVVGTKPITNRSVQGSLRLRVEVGVDYESDPEHAEEIALGAIESVESVIDSPPPRVVPTRFGDSAVILELRFWIENPDPPTKWHAIAAVINTVKERFEAEDIKIPFPQRELSGRAETGGFRVRDDDTTDKLDEER